MKLTANKNEPHYHDCVLYVDKVFLDGAEIKNCISLDTTAGSLVRTKLPLQADTNGDIETETLFGKVSLTWKTGPEHGNREHNNYVEQLIQQCEATHGPR